MARRILSLLLQGYLANDVSTSKSLVIVILTTNQVTLLRKARSRSRIRLPSYFLNFPRSLATIRSIRLYQSVPMTVDTLDSSSCNRGDGGSRSSISNRSEASCRKESRLAGDQKKGCDAIVSALGLSKKLARILVSISYIPLLWF